MHFLMGKWRFSIWVNVTFLTYSKCIVRSESDTMLKEVDMCYSVMKELESSSEYFGRYCKKVVNQLILWLSLKKLKLYS